MRDLFKVPHEDRFDVEMPVVKFPAYRLELSRDFLFGEEEGPTDDRDDQFFVGDERAEENSCAFGEQEDFVAMDGDGVQRERSGLEGGRGKVINCWAPHMSASARW